MRTPHIVDVMANPWGGFQAVYSSPQKVGAAGMEFETIEEALDYVAQMEETLSTSSASLKCVCGSAKVGGLHSTWCDSK